MNKSLCCKSNFKTLQCWHYSRETNTLNIGKIQGRLTPPMLALFKGDNSSHTFSLQSVFNIQKWVVID